MNESMGEGEKMYGAGHRLSGQWESRNLLSVLPPPPYNGLTLFSISTCKSIPGLHSASCCFACNLTYSGLIRFQYWARNPHSLHSQSMLRQCVCIGYRVRSQHEILFFISIYQAWRLVLFKAVLDACIFCRSVGVGRHLTYEYSKGWPISWQTGLG